jgi:hypothetical protein
VSIEFRPVCLGRDGLRLRANRASLRQDGKKVMFTVFTYTLAIPGRLIIMYCACNTICMAQNLTQLIPPGPYVNLVSSVPIINLAFFKCSSNLDKVLVIL